jgi:RNase H-fold protein (predicted Holliday junction resolvase)
VGVAGGRALAWDFGNKPIGVSCNNIPPICVCGEKDHIDL